MYHYSLKILRTKISWFAKICNFWNNNFVDIGYPPCIHAYRQLRIAIASMKSAKVLVLESFSSHIYIYSIYS